jgi:SAM-dependent methyltransferase
MRFAPNVCCTNVGSRLVALRDQLFQPIDRERVMSRELTLEDLALLELFSVEGDPAAVLNRLTEEGHAAAAEKHGNWLAHNRLGQQLRTVHGLRLFLGRGRVLVLPAREGAEIMDSSAVIDLSPLARESPGLVTALFADRTGRRQSLPGLEVSETLFRERLRRLVEESFIVPDVGSIDWGDLKRRQPFCQAFGYLRGTPVDRYYLYKFRVETRGMVKGKVLEIGGKLINREVYGFADATEYRTLDLPGVADESFNSVIAFHVLEHCERPDRVIENVRRWLVPGGTALVAVPTVQRVHAFPRDYWRLLPDGLRSLFRVFDSSRSYVYGNLAAVIASMCGIAAEELGSEELDRFHPDYPVLACVAARR